MWEVWTGLGWLRIERERERKREREMAGTCECGNEPLGSIKCGELFDKVHNG
jgi:hypothetical protein